MVLDRRRKKIALIKTTENYAKFSKLNNGISVLWHVETDKPARSCRMIYNLWNFGYLKWKGEDWLVCTTAKAKLSSVHPHGQIPFLTHCPSNMDAKNCYFSVTILFIQIWWKRKAVIYVWNVWCPSYYLQKELYEGQQRSLIENCFLLFAGLD